MNNTVGNKDGNQVLKDNNNTSKNLNATKGGIN